MNLIGYARVSTQGQALDSQVAQLKAAGCSRLFTEKGCGAHSDRRELGRLMETLSAGDALVVTRIDRLARSTRDLLNILHLVVAKKAQFRSLGEAWADTATPHGRLMLGVWDASLNSNATSFARGHPNAYLSGAPLAAHAFNSRKVC
jgi:DNA invertase Pin-like site-specific DNA recombinase